MNFLRSCFGLCQLRTGVIIIAIVDILFGLYEIIDYGYRIYQEINLHHSSISAAINKTNEVTNHTNNTIKLATKHSGHGALYDDSAFAAIIIGVIDLFLFFFVLFVAIMRKYDVRVVLFVASIWSFVMGFLSFISFGISLAVALYVELVIYLCSSFMNVFFGYVILSYFKQVTVVVERGLNEMPISYFPNNQSEELAEVQMDDAIDERPIMDDQDDFPMQNDYVYKPKEGDMQYII